jgi:pyruvate/2-oxoglutarate/acetoin dehydrogenase E1 component
MPAAAIASSSSPRYFDCLKAAMQGLAADPRVVFVGQAVRYPGTAMYGTLDGIPDDRRIEFPVAEELQMGASIGLAMTGKIPVSIFPRWNFLLLATNQIVNHLDKLAAQSRGGYRPRVIVRTAVGSVRPLDPQHQHRGDFTSAFRMMCENINVVRLEEPEDIAPAYHHALTRPDAKPTILVEYGDSYQEK